MSDIAQLYVEKLEDETLILSPDSESRYKLNAAIREELQKNSDMRRLDQEE